MCSRSSPPRLWDNGVGWLPSGVFTHTPRNLPLNLTTHNATTTINDMPRRLPWKTAGASPAPAKRDIKPESPRLSAITSPRAPKTPASASRTPFRNAPRERDTDHHERLRSPSTSPPPEPPAEQFMIPGPLNDDRYRMVEDEFLNIAHQFTVHLHRAEYNRLKNLAKAQNADTIKEIERPVVGNPTLLARQQRDRTRRTARQRDAGLRDEVDLPRTETGLRGLLESPRKEAKWISTTAAGIAKTRAAAGYSATLSSPPRPRRSPQLLAASRKRQLPEADDETADEETTEGSDDDLATPARRPAAKPAQVPSSVTSRSTAWPLSTPRRAIGSSSVNNSPRPTPGTNRPDVTPSRAGTSRAVTSSRHDGDENDDDDDPFGIKKRRIQRQQSREQFRKTEQKTPRKEPSPDNIPSFM
ncbi:hypothetical protein B0T10DRAFT_222016 [Thelonectria olida]|uniref:Uncharacterized protein n=1 Tax=Thelonectria olida TaxID=1576542 RepID=A0A9P8WEJ7_9HYPO|nr:hypothetical protein B0T10DRAFT_222016 [Thelonectria olida]